MTTRSVLRNSSKKRATSRRRSAAATRGRRYVCGNFAGPRQRLDKVPRVLVDVGVVERKRVGEVCEETAEQRRIHARRDRQEQIRVLGCRGAPRIDHDQFGAALALGRSHPLIQHRMAPRRVRAHQHDQIGFVEILVDTGHGVGAEGAAVAGDGRGHAQAGIGVDVGRAEEALHQLVGDVVVLGEQLPGEIERDRVRSVTIDDRAQPVAQRRRAPCPNRRARANHPPAAASDAAGAGRATASRQVRNPSSTAVRNSPGARGRPRSSRRRCRPAPPAPRSRPRNMDTSCARPGDAQGRAFMPASRRLGRSPAEIGITQRVARRRIGRRRGPRGTT